MAEPHSIAAFPANIDRTSFGHYLSGFVAGEGFFQLLWKTTTPIVRFGIGLRADDADILRLIQSYWHCGVISFYTPTDKRKWKQMWNTAPSCQFYVRTTPDLFNVVIPHFDTFPLRAKKQNDFAIWRQGVSLAWEVYQRRQTAIGRGTDGRIAGTSRRWRDEEKARFMELAHLLREQRAYNSATPLLLPDQPPASLAAGTGLFDGLE